VSWPPKLLLTREHLPWLLDAAAARTSTDALLALPWTDAFDAMDALEAGAVANPGEQRRVGHFWLRAPERAPTVGLATAIGDALEQARTLAADVREGRATNDAGDRFTDVLHVGIGGSALGPQLLVEALGDDAEGRPLGLPIHFVDNADPAGLARTLGRLGGRLATTLVVSVSKSGSTAEPKRALEAIRRALADRGVRGGRNLVAVTQPGSALARQAEAEAWAAVVPIWDWVGGRFSLMSAVGVLPGELAGVPTSSLLAGAREMDAWTRTRDVLDNPAAVLAGTWLVQGHGRGARDLVVLPYADRLEKLGRYLQQLVMESLGKREDLAGRVVEQGLTVYGNKGSTDQHAFVQQLRDGRDDALVHLVEVLDPGADDPPQDDGVRLGDQLQGFLLGTRAALIDRGRPSITLGLRTLDAASLGGLIALFERAVGLYATLIGVNAYDQPGVEAGKLAATRLLDLGRRLDDRLAEGAADVPALAAALGADPVDVLHLLLRRRATGRARVAGDPVVGRWSR
jgi:glucose-6-phosphate isomerase